jgi:hypothetical protein
MQQHRLSLPDERQLAQQQLPLIAQLYSPLMMAQPAAFPASQQWLAPSLLGQCAVQLEPWQQDLLETDPILFQQASHDLELLGRLQEQAMAAAAALQGAAPPGALRAPPPAKRQRRQDAEAALDEPGPPQPAQAGRVQKASQQRVSLTKDQVCVVMSGIEIACT